MHKFIAILMAAFFTLLTTGCSTVEGVGKDIKKAGTVIEEEAAEEKKKVY